MSALPVGPGLRQWFRPPRHLLVLYLGTTLGFWAVLVWLGWSSLRQDLALEAQAEQDRLERGSDAIAAEIRRELAEFDAQLEQFSLMPDAELEASLASAALRLGPDVVLVAISGRTPADVRAFPRHRLLYYPELSEAQRPFLSPLASSRAYALLGSDPPAAVEMFGSLVGDRDARVRAEALLGMARAQAASGRREAALATYGALDDPDVLVDGRPAELLARLGRVELLTRTGRTAEHQEELLRLYRDLRAARWRLTRAAYLHYAGQVRDALGDTAELPSTDVPLALAAGVHALWELHRDGASDGGAGRASRVFNDQFVYLAWRESGDRLLALAAGPLFLDEQVIGPIRPMLDRQGIRAVFEDADGRPVLHHGAIAEAGGRQAESAPSATGLPWTLRVASADLGADRQSTTKRQLIIAGLAFLGLFVAAGSYLSVRAMTREIEAARLKSDFVAAVSHEFRTPLTLLRQFSDLLADDRVTSEQERRRYYAALQRGTRRLTRLVEDLLDFGRMEAGSRAFTLEPVAARSWALALAEEFREEVRSRGYHVEVDWQGPADVVIQADQAAMGRALWNLLDNAVKYSPSCRTVWLDGRFENGRLTVSVRDRGLGVSTHEQRAIFRKFVRGSSTGAHKIKGTGLGLALVEQIVEAHGGSVHVESTEGQGSTFSLVLPARLEPVSLAREWRAS